MIPEITTQRLILRQFSTDDWPDLYEYLSQPETVAFEPYEVFSEEAARQEAVNRSQSDAFWAVCLKDSRKLIGNLYLEKQQQDTWELGYVFNKDYRDKGYATEAARSLITHVFDNCQARRIVAMCNPLNSSSWRLLERLGMRREGHLKQNIYFKMDSGGNPIWCDTYEYAILRSDWPEPNK